MCVQDPQPTSCSHMFAWHSVVPPSHCPHCGACLNCGSPYIAAPPWPQPTTWPWWSRGPTYSTTVTSINTTSHGTPMNGVMATC